MNWSEVRSQISGMSHLATSTPHGDPHVSIVSAYLDDDIVWVATNHSSRKARNLRSNPRAMIMWEGDAEVYVAADAELVDDLETKQRLWAGAFPYDLEMFFRAPDNPDLVLIRLAPRSAVVQTFGDSGPERRRWTA